MKWENGRQGIGYEKLLLLESKRFKFDVYLLRFSPFTIIRDHTDPAPEGYKHYRWNWMLKGTGLLYKKEREYDENYIGTETKMTIWSGGNSFCASDVVHGFVANNRFNCMAYMLSIGWLKK